MDDKRRHVRLQVLGPERLEVHALGQKTACVMEDISAGGLRMVFQGAAKPAWLVTGAEVEVTLEALPEHTLVLPGKITRVEPRATAQGLVIPAGVRFTDVPAARRSALDAILLRLAAAKLKQAPPPEPEEQ